MVLEPQNLTTSTLYNTPWKVMDLPLITYTIVLYDMEVYSLVSIA